MKNIFSNFQDYLDADPAGVKLPKIKIDQNLLSQLSLPQESSSYDILKALSREGIKKRGIDKYPNKKEYYDRAKYELETFEELGFTDYILLNWEIIGFAKKSGIPTGNGRGSAPGSLILYLLEVTEEDPVKYGLIFERFVSKSRAKKITDKRGEVFLDGSLVPDVDSDFCYERRSEVIKFVEERHKGRTAKILTFNTFSSKLCIREAVKYFDKADEESANVISASIPKKHGIVSSLKEADESSEKFKEWKERSPFTFSQAIKVEDLIKNEGNHPSGVAIASQKIEDIMPLQLNKEGELISGYDMDDVAALCVKFDILGLRTLTIADLTCKKLGISLKDIDPEDPFIYEKLQDFKHNSGLFQISASTNSLVCQQVKPLNLDELSDVIALARPSSLAYVGEYIKQKNFQTDLGVCPTLDELLKPTKNIFLFQETFMQACHKVFGFSLEEAETFRRVISKKKVEEMPAWESKIFEAAEKEGLPKSAAKYFWEASEAAANYGFNKCIFEEETVETSNGEYIALKDCRRGDSIKAFNTKSCQTEYVDIKNVYHNSKIIYEIILENGKKIRTSEDHKFFCDNGKMVPLKEIIGSDLKILSL